MARSNGPNFNTPPGWPRPPDGWLPPSGWTPDPAWPPPPEGWQLWTSSDSSAVPLDERRPSDYVEVQTEPVLETESSRIVLLEAENASLIQQLSDSDSTVDGYVELNDAIVLQNVGIYRYNHPLENAAAFRDRLSEIESRISQLVKSERAIVKSTNFTFDNSLAKGRRMTTDLAKLMLRAYNAEADNCIRTLRVGNVVTAKKRLEASRAAIAKLSTLMEMRISTEFHALRIEEIELTADWLMKKQEEKEAEREERARLREERRVEKELIEERSRLDKERAHIINALQALHATGGDDPELEERLQAIDNAIVQNDFRAANIRAGYVYVISNRGAFGEDVVKIGLTRRLEPADRITELSGASVPFRFDIHCLFFSEDAVTLETELHQHFSSRALNVANPRKEFFFTTPAEVRDVLSQKVGSLLEFNERAEATEYLQSVGKWPGRLRSSIGQ